MSEFDDLFDEDKKEPIEIEEKPLFKCSFCEKKYKNEKRKEKHEKTCENNPNAEKKETEKVDNIAELVIKTNNRITITKLMTCHEILVGKTIRKNKEETIDDLVEELAYILINHKLKNQSITKEEVIKILQSK